MGDFSIVGPVSLLIFGSLFIFLSLIAFLLFVLKIKNLSIHKLIKIAKSSIKSVCSPLFEFISLYASSVIMPIFSFWDNAKSKEQSTAFDSSSYHLQRSPLASRSLNQFSPGTNRYSFNQGTSFTSPSRENANSTLSYKGQSSDFLPPVRRISSFNRSHFSPASPLSSSDVTSGDENLNTSYQLRYRVGQLPITRIKSPSHPRLTRENSVKSTVRIAPPNQFKPALPSIKRVNSSQDSIQPAVPIFNPSSTTSVLSSIREKRKINKLTDESEFDSEEGPTKRRQIITDDSRTGETSKETVPQSHKRPASTDLEKDPEFCEAASKKHRPEDDSDSDDSSLEEGEHRDLSSSLSICVRNPVDVSLSSSRLWLQRMMDQSENQSVGSSRSSSPVPSADLKPTSISPDKQVPHRSNLTSDIDANNVHCISEPLTRSDSVNTDDTSSHSNFSAEIDNLSTYPHPSTSRDTSARSTPRQAFLLKSFADSCAEKESEKENPKISVNQNLKSKLRHTQIMNTLRDPNAVQTSGLSSAHQSTVTLEEFEADRSADLERVNEILSSITQTENPNSILGKTKENSNNPEVTFNSTAFTPSSKQSAVPVSSVISSQNTTTTSLLVTNNNTSSHSATLQVPSFSQSFTASSVAGVAQSSVLTSAVLAPASVQQTSSFALSSSSFSPAQSIPSSSLSVSSSTTNSLPAATLLQSTLPGTSTQTLIKSEPSITTAQFGLPNKEALSTLVKSTPVLTSGFNSPFAQAVTTCSVLTQPAGFSSNSQLSRSSVAFSSASFSFGSQAVQSTINNTGSQLQQTAGFSSAPSTPAPQLKPSVGFSLTPSTSQNPAPQLKPSVGFSLTSSTAQTTAAQVQPSVGFSLTSSTAQTTTAQVQPSVGFSLTPNTSQPPTVSGFQFDTKPANNNPPATQQSFNNFNNSSSIGANNFTFGSTSSVNPSPLSMANMSNSSTQSFVGSILSNTATSSSAQQNVFSQGAASVFGKFPSSSSNQMSTASAMSEQPKPFFQQVTPQETAKPASPFMFGQQSITTSNVASAPNPFSTPVKTNQMNAFGDGKNVSNISQPLPNAPSFNFTATPTFGTPPASSVSATPFGIASTTSSNAFQPAFSSNSFGGSTTQFSASTAATLGTSNFNFGQATPNFGDAANAPRLPTPTFNIGAGSSTSSSKSYRARRRGGRR